MNEYPPKKFLREKNKPKAKVKNNEPDKIPFGRDEVKTAILDATEKLLLQRNPNQISVREIAKLANVKHPQIYRHFGSKNNLITAVYARSAENVKKVIGKIGELEGNIGTFFQAVEKNKSRQIALARAMIDGVDPNLLQNQFSVMQHLLELIKKRQNESESEPKFDARIASAVLTATAMGWILYEPFLLASTGLEKENIGEIKQKVAEILEELVRVVG